MQFNIIYVGNIKDKYLADAASEYEKRLGAYGTVKNIELKEEKITDGASPAEIASAIAREGERILAALPQKSYKIALCVEGKEMSSEEYAAFLGKARDTSAQITFIVGGAFGLSEDVKKICDARVSLSKMTFTHRMARVLLLEQTYRAFNILSGGKYHK